MTSKYNWTIKRRTKGNENCMHDICAAIAFFCASTRKSIVWWHVLADHTSVVFCNFRQMSTQMQNIRKNGGKVCEEARLAKRRPKESENRTRQMNEWRNCTIRLWAVCKMHRHQTSLYQPKSKRKNPPKQAVRETEREKEQVANNNIDISKCNTEIAGKNSAFYCIFCNRNCDGSKIALMLSTKLIKSWKTQITQCCHNNNIAIPQSFNAD